MDKEITNRIDLLKEKYDAIDQDLETHLDGLLHSKPMRYWDFVQTDALLSLQGRVRGGYCRYSVAMGSLPSPASCSHSACSGAWCDIRRRLMTCGVASTTWLASISRPGRLTPRAVSFTTCRSVMRCPISTRAPLRSR